MVALLSDPSLCTSAYTKLFPEEELDGSTFWPLIQALARRGVYVVEDEDVAVNHTVLAQTSPFRQVCVCVCVCAGSMYAVFILLSLLSRPVTSH